MRKGEGEGEGKEWGRKGRREQQRVAHQEHDEKEVDWGRRLHHGCMAYHTEAAVAVAEERTAGEEKEKWMMMAHGVRGMAWHGCIKRGIRERP